jgi:cytoskeleton protein RodZ
MKQKTSSENNSQSHKTVDGPGSQLRKARERQGLEQAKMAAQLHLSQSMIQALEWDDYEKLPAAVFVQGYLRNYARLLGVEENAIIHAYQELHPNVEQQPLPRNQPDEVAQELHSDHRLIRFTTWGVLLMLGVLVFFWWQGRMESPEPPTPTVDESEAIEPGFALPPQDEVTPAEEAGFAPIRESERESGPAAIEAEPTVPTAEAPSPEPSSISLSSESEQQEEAAPISEAAETPATSLSTEREPLPEEAIEPEAPATMPDGLLVFEFLGPCWMEVRDATGRARIVGVMREGMRRRLDAQLGPFRVVIGDIHAVRLSVNGEIYDLGRHTRGKVARFTLDPSKL